MDKKELSIQAKKLIKKLMIEEDISYVELQKKLEEKGYIYSVEALRSKVSRGRYDIRFLLEIAEALKKKVEISSN